MAEDNKTLKDAQLQANEWLAEEINGKKLIQILAEKGESFDLTTLGGCLDLKKKYDALKKEQNSDGGNGNKDGNGGEGAKNTENKEKNDNTLEVSERKPEKPEENQNKDWIEQKRETWTKWCEQEHNPAYVYDEDKEFKNGLKFDVYKTPEDKEAGNIAATVAYTSPRKVAIETEEGKAPDYEFFAKLTKEAKEHDNVPGVTFKGEMTPEFKARLAASCLENGLNMVDGPDFIDVNLLGNVSEDLKKKVADFNKAKKYETLYTQLVTAKKAEIDNRKEKEPDKPVVVHLDEKIDSKESPEFAAIAYAAYVNAGAEVDGVEKVFNKNPEGLIHSSDFKLMPKDVQDTVSKHNKEIHDKMLNRTKNRVSVAQPAVAEKEITPREAMSNQATPLESANNQTQQKIFRQFVLQGFEQKR